MASINNLKQIREIYGATQEQIARALSVNRVTVANWENGTTGIKNLALNDMLSNLEVKSPDEMELKDFYLLFNNIMNKISSNSNENIKLEQLRDTLLPKLMNGEIDLDNIEI